MNWKILNRNSLIILAVLISALVIGAVFYSTGKSEIVASINGEKITKTELYELMLKQNGQEALNTLISDRLVKLEAEKQNISVSEQDIQKELEKYYEYYGGQEAFTQTLASSGYSLDDVKKDLELSLEIRMLMQPRISISDEELKDYFEENKDSFARDKQIKASHILVDTQEKASEIKKRLDNGEDFAGLARESSSDTATRDNGGQLGLLEKGEMASEFEAAAFTLKAGEISAPVKTEFGYHIIKVEEIIEAREANYEQNKDMIYESVFEQKVDVEFNTWLQEMYQKYKIETFLVKQ